MRWYQQTSSRCLSNERVAELHSWTFFFLSCALSPIVSCYKCALLWGEWTVARCDSHWAHSSSTNCCYMVYTAHQLVLGIRAFFSLLLCICPFRIFSCSKTKHCYCCRCCSPSARYNRYKVVGKPTVLYSETPSVKKIFPPNREVLLKLLLSDGHAHAVDR